MRAWVVLAVLGACAEEGDLRTAPGFSGAGTPAGTVAGLPGSGSATARWLRHPATNRRPVASQ